MKIKIVKIFDYGKINLQNTCIVENTKLYGL